MASPQVNNPPDHLELVVACGGAGDDDARPEVGLRHRHPVEVRALPLHRTSYGLQWFGLQLDYVYPSFTIFCFVFFWKFQLLIWLQSSSISYKTLRMRRRPTVYFDLNGVHTG